MDKSRAYSKIVERLKNNTYKKNLKQLKTNRKYLNKTRKHLESRNNSSIKYKKGHAHKLEKVALLQEALSGFGETVDGLRGALNEFKATTKSIAAPAPELKSVQAAWINETLAQGDCFYSSIYRAARERNLLPAIAAGLGIDISNEDAFVVSFRALVADEVRAGRLPNSISPSGARENTYNILSHMGANLGAAIAYGNVFPDWFVRSFSKGVGTRKHFQDTFARYAAQRNQYVSEIEVDIVRTLLKDRCRIMIEITGLIKSLINTQKDGMPLLTLYNAYGGHYEYYSFDASCPGKQSRNPKTRKCS